MQGVSYGKPAACLLFDLAYHLGQENANMLWLALVGLTDHLVHGRLAGAAGGALASMVGSSLRAWGARRRTSGGCGGWSAT